SLFEREHNDARSGRCADMARKLLASEGEKVPLHGDLHHGNVLDAGPRGWLAIDPKALLGDRAYDVANLLRNPEPHGALVHNQDRMNRLARFYARRLGLEVQRVLGFAFAHAGLAARWDLEDGDNPTYSFKCVDTLAPLTDG
ncbi:MAG: aminoglycoside phosphotransferase family protein, partial [Alphaproteobacteria bacterium]